eukprot:TRINITY_DN57_c0_g1_i2.p1 TRINITY_DN57_c0_g1~~TRINITY_DN57_c0_g1_i2.p1  ORF type:complete len:127 (+),score=27.15 TRINITY_DN57_c0_g1_i2:52-381(+)
MTSHGIALGINKGYKVTKLNKRQNNSTLSRKRVHRRASFIREVIREVGGHAPYEKRLLELLRVGSEKKALRFAKRKLGTQRSAKKKRDIITRVIQEERAKKKAEEATAE